MKYSASEPERQVVYAYADDIKAKDAEIERLKAALRMQTSEPDIFGIVTSTLATAAPGLGEPIREAIASSIVMKIKAANG